MYFTENENIFRVKTTFFGETILIGVELKEFGLQCIISKQPVDFGQLFYLSIHNFRMHRRS